MKTYEINMTRIGYGHARYTVEAPNEKEARKRALEVSGSYDYSEHDAEYEIENITEA